VFAGQHRQLMLAAGAELLPLVIEPPQPPVEPSGRAFEEGAAQPRVSLEDARGGHAGDGPHQLDRIANGMGDRVEVGVADEAPAGIVLERGVAGRMKSDRHVELLQGTPQRLARLVVQMLAVDRVRGADDGDGAKLPDAPARLFDCGRNAVHRHLGGELQPRRLAPAIVVRPGGRLLTQDLCDHVRGSRRQSWLLRQSKREYYSRGVRECLSFCPYYPSPP